MVKKSGTVLALLGERELNRLLYSAVISAVRGSRRSSGNPRKPPDPARGGGVVIKEGCLKEVTFKLQSEEHIGIFQAKGDGGVGRGQNALSREKA